MAGHVTLSEIKNSPSRDFETIFNESLDEEDDYRETSPYRHDKTPFPIMPSSPWTSGPKSQAGASLYTFH